MRVHPALALGLVLTGLAGMLVGLVFIYWPVALVVGGGSLAALAAGAGGLVQIKEPRPERMPSALTPERRGPV